MQPAFCMDTRKGDEVKEGQDYSENGGCVCESYLRMRYRNGEGFDQLDI